MNLKDARILKNQYKQQLRELQDKRNEIALVRMEPGEDWQDYVLPTERVDILTKDIDAMMEQYLHISALIRRANNTTPVSSPVTAASGSSLSDLLEQAILLRREAALCKSLGNNRPRARVAGYNERGNLIDQATYDIPAMAERSRDLEQQAQAISAQVDRYDMEIELPISDQPMSNE